MRDWLKQWEPIEIMSVITLVGILILLALGVDSILKGGLLTTLGMIFKLAMSKMGAKKDGTANDS